MNSSPEANGIEQPNLAGAAFQADPFPFWARLRREAPVYRARLRLPGRRAAWLVTRYDDAVAALKDERLLKDPRTAFQAGGKEPWVPAMLKPLQENMLDLDGADHARLRRLVQRAFTPRRVEEMRDRIQALCDRLMGAMEHRGRADLLREYALPLPITIIAELLGIPEPDMARFHRWSTRVVQVASPTGVVVAIPALWRFLRYLRALVDERRARPRDDLVSALVQAEDAGDQLSGDELLAMITILLIAGHETTVNLIASGTLALLTHPDQLQRLRDEPALLPLAVEELVRFVSPVSLATERYAREPLEIAGERIAPGDLVLVALSSANRDERQFAAPDALDVTRAPNRHLAFGQGIHFCVGAPLARLEAQAAFATLLRRAPGLRLAAPAGSLRWNRGLFLRGLRHLPVAL
jgi:cytochrome P450 PksS